MKSNDGAVVIDASNLRVGGAVQVASAFLHDLSEIVDSGEYADRFEWLAGVHVEASPEVVAAVNGSQREARMSMRQSRGWRSAREWLRPRARPQLRFTVFGPRRRPAWAKVHLMGYADVLSIYPEYSDDRGAARRLISAGKRRLSLAEVRRCDGLVVETDAVKDRVARQSGIEPDRVSVVPNSYHPIFDAISPPARDWANVDAENFNFLYVARAYAHKNHDFLGAVLDGLNRAAEATTYRVVVTLTELEWENRSEHV